jgi:hypothetical protein
MECCKHKLNLHWCGAVYLGRRRVWTIFEQHAAIKLDIQVDMVLPKQQALAFTEELVKHGPDAVLQNLRLSTINVEIAHDQVFVHEDEVKVKAIIGNGVGFD